MIIYKITNKLNGKTYIGQTRNTVAQRVKSHITGKSKIGKAMLEDGQENFDVSVIDNAETQEELDELERFWIAFYNACETGYNTLIGGKPTKNEFKMLSKMGRGKSKCRKKRKKRLISKRQERVSERLEIESSNENGKCKHTYDDAFYKEYVRRWRLCNIYY